MHWTLLWESLRNPEIDRDDLVELLEKLKLDRKSVAELVAAAPIDRRSMFELLEDAGYNAGQTIMEEMEDRGLFVRTGEYVRDRKGRIVPCYRPAADPET